LATQTVRLQKAGLRIRYAELGDPENPPVILLHGVPENLQAWYAVAPLLAKNYRVLAFDWPGFGGSEPFGSATQYSSRRFAEVITDFMDSLHIPRAHLVATDIALLPALLVSLESPGRVDRLAVMDGIPFPRPQHASWELRSFAKVGSIRGKALVRWFPRLSARIAYIKGFYRGHEVPAEVRSEFLADGMSTTTQDAFLSYFQNFRAGQEYFEARAQELQSEVLVVWGKYDRFISSRLGEEIADTLPNARLEIIDEAGHYVHMDKPKEVVRVVSRFLAEGLSAKTQSAPTLRASTMSKHKTAFLIWLAVLPTVLVLSTLLARLPIELPNAVSIFLVTALAIPTVVYILLPRLTRLAERRARSRAAWSATSSPTDSFQRASDRSILTRR
jgi:pimeloyl-ACP methyl ester carboxylesterase